MSLPIFQVDAFTNRPFSGNPAAVCILDGPRDDAWMQNVAREMNLSETAFVQPTGGGTRFGLRWFTPTLEVALCGHATLASAHVLWEQGLVSASETIRFDTKSGELLATKAGSWIELQFPLDPPVEMSPPDGLLDALRVSPVYVGKSRFDWLVEVISEEVLRGLSPDFVALASVLDRGVIVTCHSSSPDYNFVSRFFAPVAGIDEDPVTGSAHCCLGPYWQAKLGKQELRAFQASARGGELHVRVEADHALLRGQSVTMFCGQWTAI